MKVKLIIKCWLVCVSFGVSLIGSLAAGELDPASIEFFETQVRPLLVNHCYKCHSEEAAKGGKLKGGLLLDTSAGVQKGATRVRSSSRESRTKAHW